MAIYIPQGGGGGAGDPTMGGDLTGTASNAQIAAGAIVDADVSASAAISTSKLVKTMGGSISLGPSRFATDNPSIISTFKAYTASHIRTRRVQWPKSGTLSELYVLLAAAAGNLQAAVYDTGQANADHTIRTRLDALASFANSSTGWISLGNPNISVTEGVTAELCVAADSATTTIGSGNASGNIPALPANYFASSGAGTATIKWVADYAVTLGSLGATVTDAAWTVYQWPPVFLFAIT